MIWWIITTPGSSVFWTPKQTILSQSEFGTCAATANFSFGVWSKVRSIGAAPEDKASAGWDIGSDETLTDDGFDSFAGVSESDEAGDVSSFRMRDRCRQPKLIGIPLEYFLEATQ
jgi:hypothetical protein